MKVINKQISNNIMMTNMPAIAPEDIVVGAIESENDIDSGNNFQPAKQSPRIEDNILKWYFLDQFKIDWNLVLTTNSIDDSIKPGQIIIEFYKEDLRELVHTFTEDYNPTNPTISLIFDDAQTKKFLPGKYVFCVKYVESATSEDDFNRKITLFANQKAEVELCH